MKGSWEKGAIDWSLDSPKTLWHTFKIHYILSFFGIAKITSLLKTKVSPTHKNYHSSVQNIKKAHQVAKLNFCKLPRTLGKEKKLHLSNL